MKNVYIIIGQSTGCNGNIIHWTEMNQTMAEHDSNYKAYISGPILLDETEEPT